MRRVPLVVTLLLAAVIAPAASARVLLVGSYHGIHGKYRSIQAAVDAARSGDWVLVGPGDYKERADHRRNRGPQPSATPAGVVIAKAALHLRGMNRNTVVVDGTRPGSTRCSNRGSAQDFGPSGATGQGPLGRNGILVWKAANVSVQNLTVCNFLGGSGDAGNEVWWNGGDGSGKVGGRGYLGTYLSGTSTYFSGNDHAAKYGLFTSNWTGGTWDQIYGSNMNDSGFYIGACQQICNQVVNHAHGQFNVLGYSGTNSGGSLIVENSEFDHNQDGFDTNSQNADNPSPQNGACPGNKISPISQTTACWVFVHNYVHDNNNNHAPAAGTAAEGPVGTGMSVSGGRNDMIMDNTFANNKAWGIIVVPFTDSGQPCLGGTLNNPLLGQGTCLFDEWGIHVIHNRFTGNGGYGNPTNGQFGQFNLEPHPSSCFAGNSDASGQLTATASGLEQKFPHCTDTPTANLDVSFLNEVLCDTGVKVTGFGCQPGDKYPQHGTVVMHPLPRNLATMPNPCQGVPVNAWCPRRRGTRA